MNRRVAVRAVMVIDGKLLAVKLKPYKEAIIGDLWCTIGGGIDEGEGLIESLTREVVEETGVTPVVGNLLYVQQFAYGGKEHLEFFFHVTNAEDFLSIDLSTTTHGAEEIAEIGFVDPVASNVLPEFLRSESYENLSTQPTKFFNYL